jgi:flagellar motor switch protein FliN/FliY
MSTDTPAAEGEQDALADEWAAALAEAKPAADASTSGALATTDRVEDASHLFPKLSGGDATPEGRQDIDMILDIPVQLTVELGRTRIPIKHILQLAQGSVIELDALAGEPMDVLVNGCLIAQGEVVVVNDKFGIRLTDIVTPSERVRRLNRT